MKRYNLKTIRDRNLRFFTDMIEDSEGEYVLHSEAQERIDALTAERDALLKEREETLKQEPIAWYEHGKNGSYLAYSECKSMDQTPLYSKPLPPAIPEGYVMVPVIVSPEIESVYSNSTGAYQSAQELHDAMIAASQKGGA